MSITALEPTFANTWRVDVDIASSADSPNWKQVRGVNNFQPALENTRVDVSDYDTDGWGAEAVVSRRWNLVTSTIKKIDPVTKQVDEALDFLREAADDLSLVHVRWYERFGADGEAYEGWGSVEWAPQGGSPTDPNTVQITILGQGARNEITHPLAGSSA